MQVNILYNTKGVLFQNLHKAAKRKLKATGADHVVFGVERNARGQLSTFFKPMSDAELEVYDREYTGGSLPILAVHR